jgi:hypothetical protein
VQDFRRSFERRVGPCLALAARLPRAVPFLVVAGLLLLGLLLQGVVGAALLLVLSVLLGSLLLLSWPALEPGARAIRSAVVLIVVVRALSFLT